MAFVACSRDIENRFLNKLHPVPKFKKTYKRCEIHFTILILESKANNLKNSTQKDNEINFQNTNTKQSPEKISKFFEQKRQFCLIFISLHERGA